MLFYAIRGQRVVNYCNTSCHEEWGDLWKFGLEYLSAAMHGLPLFRCLAAIVVLRLMPLLQQLSEDTLKKLSEAVQPVRYGVYLLLSLQIYSYMINELPTKYEQLNDFIFVSAPTASVCAAMLDCLGSGTSSSDVDYHLLRDTGLGAGKHRDC